MMHYHISTLLVFEKEGQCSDLHSILDLSGLPVPAHKKKDLWTYRNMSVIGPLHSQPCPWVRRLTLIWCLIKTARKIINTGRDTKSYGAARGVHWVCHFSLISMDFNSHMTMMNRVTWDQQVAANNLSTR